MNTTSRRGRTKAFSLVAAATIAISLGGGSAALADDGDTGVDAESIVTTQGLILESPQSTEAAAADGELVQAWEVIQPITDAQATSTLEGNAQLASESDHSFVTGIGANGNPTSIIVIDSASAPSTYSFHIGGEGGADLVLNKDGSVTVLDEMGMPMNGSSDIRWGEGGRAVIRR